MNCITIEFDLKDDKYLTSLRLVAGSVCSMANVTIDVSADFKAAVTEAVLILTRNGFNRLKATFNVEGGVVATILGMGGEIVKGNNEYSLAIISALIEQATFTYSSGEISSVTLKI